jgi:hypothetical protein
MIGPAIQRSPVCLAAVQFFDAPADVGAPYVEVARLSVSWPADMVTDLRAVEKAERSKAAKLGANGIIRGQLVDRDSLQPSYVSDVSGLAIFIAADSGRTADACAATPRRD